MAPACLQTRRAHAKSEGPDNLSCAWRPQRELARSTLSSGKAPLPLVPWEDASVSPPHLPGKEKLTLGRKLRQARHKSELFQLSTQITIERLNTNKCCRFIHNASFYLWNVSEWSKDTKMLLEILVNQERQPRP